MGSDQRRRTDFSIESLLRKTPTHPRNEIQVEEVGEESSESFSWLTCTRFKPPKLPRNKKRNPLKRFGRGPRIPFSPQQIVILEKNFEKSQYLSSDAIQRIADSLNLSETRVKIWFQNRRARFRREKETPQESFSKGTSHQNIQLTNSKKSRIGHSSNNNPIEFQPENLKRSEFFLHSSTPFLYPLHFAPQFPKNSGGDFTTLSFLNSSFERKKRSFETLCFLPQPDKPLFITNHL